MDEQGRPWVAWPDVPTTGIAARNASDDWWQVSPPKGQGFTQLAFDGQNRLHIAALTRSDSYDDPDILHYGLFDPSHSEDGWHTETVDEELNGHPDMDIAIGPDDAPHIVWERANHKSIHAERQPDGSWEKTTLPVCDWGRNALDVDLDGRVHIVCKSLDEGLIYHVRDATGAWSHEVANDGSQLVPPRTPFDVGISNDLETDEVGRPHVVYRTGLDPFAPDDPRWPEHPIYTVKIDGDWHVKDIDREGSGTAETVSIGLDRDGRPQVGYMHARRLSELGCSDTVNPCFDLRFAEPLAATAERAGQQALGR